MFKQLRQYGQLRRQEIGIGIQTITPIMSASLNLPRDYGVIVSDVLPGSPAEANGVKTGDILVSVDGQPADNLPTVNYYFRLRDSTENAQLTVLRDGNQKNLSVPVVELKSELDDVSSMANAERNLVATLGILGVEIDQRIASMAKGLRDPYGIIVVARTAGATTEVPLAVGDVIRTMNGKPMNTLDTLRNTLHSLPAGAPITFQLQREGASCTCRLRWIENGYLVAALSGHRRRVGFVGGAEGGKLKHIAQPMSTVIHLSARHF